MMAGTRAYQKLDVDYKAMKKRRKERENNIKMEMYIRTEADGEVANVQQWSENMDDIEK